MIRVPAPSNQLKMAPYVIVPSVLGAIVLMKSHPQILPSLPALLQTSMLALLSASIPLFTTICSTLTCVKSDGVYTTNPSEADLSTATSIHVLGFSSHGDLHLAESEGVFDVDTWKAVFDVAKWTCCDHMAVKDGEDVAMEDDRTSTLEGLVRSVMQTKVESEQKWKDRLERPKGEETKAGKVGGGVNEGEL